MADGMANGFSGHVATTTDVDTGNLSSDCPEHPANVLYLGIGATVYLRIVFRRVDAIVC